MFHGVVRSGAGLDAPMAHALRHRRVAKWMSHGRLPRAVRFAAISVNSCDAEFVSELPHWMGCPIAASFPDRTDPYN